MFGTGSHLRMFEDDPFFADPLRAHSEHVHQMMRSFSDPFGRDPFLSITNGRERGRDFHGSNVALRDNHRVFDRRNPFGQMDDMMSNMRSMFTDLHRNTENFSSEPNSHSFTSSSVMTYSKVGDKPAKVFQASSQMRQAPGGIKETRRAVKDSESGIEKMAIGHHIHDRAHIIEQSQNKKTGNREVNQEFVNLDETDAQTFDDEWQREIFKFMPSKPRSQLEAPKARKVQRAAIASTEDESRREKRRLKDQTSMKKTQFEDLNVNGSAVKNNKK
ncbi:myeloid leukemia factor 1 [Polypterus senegalus]|uniref:myeloid leukemia factor 1 n=1 Tax=Polypterus senegalus TaxID=55291 RepID=UPI0019643094|nr:myeloid leukemia factor 1 [Polypterus senegalus]